MYKNTIKSNFAFAEDTTISTRAEQSGSLRRIDAAVILWNKLENVRVLPVDRYHMTSVWRKHGR